MRLFLIKVIATWPLISSPSYYHVSPQLDQITYHEHWGLELVALLVFNRSVFPVINFVDFDIYFTGRRKTEERTLSTNRISQNEAAYLPT